MTLLAASFLALRWGNKSVSNSAHRCLPPSDQINDCPVLRTEPPSKAHNGFKLPRFEHCTLILTVYFVLPLSEYRITPMKHERSKKPARLAHSASLRLYKTSFTNTLSQTKEMFRDSIRTSD